MKEERIRKNGILANLHWKNHQIKSHLMGTQTPQKANEVRVESR